MEVDERAVEILNDIEKYQSIVICGHVDPDGDCVGSRLGLKTILKDNFPEKKIYVLGSTPDNLKDIAEKSDEVASEVIKESLILLVDLSDLNRAEFQEIRNGAKIDIIDHHIPSPGVENILAYRLVDAPSATFVIFDFATQTGLEISQKAAAYLYLGLITDTDRFLLDSKVDTFKMAISLIDCGVNPQDLYSKLYVPSEASLKFKAFVYSNYRFTDSTCYLVVKKDDYLSLGLSSNDIANEVSLLAGLGKKRYQAFFVERENDRVRTELRSDGSRDVEKIASHFSGGGHYAASGCQLDELADYKKVLAYIDEVEKDN